MRLGSKEGVIARRAVPGYALGYGWKGERPDWVQVAYPQVQTICTCP